MNAITITPAPNGVVAFAATPFARPCVSPAPTPALVADGSTALAVATPTTGAGERVQARAAYAFGGTPSAGSAAFSRSPMSSRLTRCRLDTSSSGTQRASSLEPPTSSRSSPPMTLAR